MSWNEELKAIPISTLFTFFGKVLAASFVWYMIASIPWIIIITITLLAAL